MMNDGNATHKDFSEALDNCKEALNDAAMLADTPADKGIAAAKFDNADGPKAELIRMLEAATDWADDYEIETVAGKAVGAQLQMLIAQIQGGNRNAGNR